MSILPRVKKHINLRCLSSPFGRYLQFFVFIFVLSSVADVIGFAMTVSPAKAAFIAMHHFAICYLAVVLLSVLPKSARRVFKWTIIALLSVNFVIDAVCVFGFHYTFNRDLPAIILATNPGESSEFIQTFFSWELAGIIAVLTAFFIILYRMLHRRPLRVSKSCQYAGVSVAALCLAIPYSMSSKNWDNVSFGKIMAFYEVTHACGLENRTIYPMNAADIKRPANVVIIIGESLRASHCSLYGYGKETNRHMKELADSGYLLTVHEAEAAGTHTIEAFQRFMTGADSNHMERMTVSDVMKAAGYRTIWLSNQAQKGFYENPVTRYAELCDTTVFTGNKFDGAQHSANDEVLLPALMSLKKSTPDSLKCFFIHMMGSHPEFNKRVPDTFAIFSPHEYPAHGEIMAAYDNSVAYNDSVVCHIMKSFHDDDTFCMYFSDHGLDLYDTSDDYFGHAKHNNEASLKAGRDIPLFIYTSSVFRSLHPEMQEMTEYSADRKVNTANLIFSIMDLLQISPADSTFEMKDSWFTPANCNTDVKSASQKS